jgi:hypothetical protein
MDKYLFKFQECSKPVDKIVENDRLVGIVFRKTKIVDGKVIDIPGSEFEVRSPLVISSIGSIPEPIPGIPSKGELFVVKDENTGQLEGYEHVFALGNAVTGRGNIRESSLHAQMVAKYVMDEYLGWTEERYQQVLQNGWETIFESGAKRVLTVEQIEQILKRIRERQKAVGYNNNFEEWVASHRPTRLEELLAD